MGGEFLPADKDPDTQFVCELHWAELYPNEMQPAEFNWMPLPGSPAGASAPADALAPADTPAANTINSSATPSRLSTPEVTLGLFVPLDLASWRQRLFEVSEGETMTLSSEQWTQYWPFVTNLWTKHGDVSRMGINNSSSINLFDLILPLRLLLLVPHFPSRCNLAWIYRKGCNWIPYPSQGNGAA
jgi:hypothetical protein